MKWIRTHKAASVIIVIIVALLFVIAGSFAGAGDSSPVGRAINTGISTVTKPLKAVSDGIKNGFRGIFESKEISKENKELKDELNELKEENRKLKLKRDEYDELKKLQEIFSRGDLKDEENVVTCEISVMDSSSWMSVFTINKGTEAGIKKGNAVVCSGGLIGKIDEAGRGWAKVRSIINENSKVSFRLAENRKQMGIVTGDGDSGLSGYMFNVKAKVKKGDKIVTSGIGDYPGGLTIGTVSEVDFNTNTQNKEVTVEPDQDFFSAGIVAVII
ncbi:MAG: rod shape-determining protein MreC [Firmicutes bacterium]|nr:rod shape-determining protein MreC [Bacillota bacterium]MBR2512238.1 rod shape-determining protein MreC [Bacillota bacterium]